MLDLKTFIRRLALGLALVMVPAVAVAGDIPDAVKIACSNDYQMHCIKHEPGSGAGRECMADVFEKLSETCVAAIMNSDLVGEEPNRATAESTVAETATPPVPVRRVATSSATRTARRANTSRSRVGAQRTASRSARRPTYASRQSRISRRIARGLRIADRHVSRALARVFR
jgi:hypothetical protein